MKQRLLRSRPRLAFYKDDGRYYVNPDGVDAVKAMEQLEQEKAQLVEELKLWMVVVNETSGVPRYQVTPGAALNTVVTSTRRLIALYDNPTD